MPDHLIENPEATVDAGSLTPGSAAPGVFIDPERISLVRIASVDDPLFPMVSRLLEQSFVADERGDFDEALLANGRFHLHGVLSSGDFVALLSWWRFDEFLFAEHFAIDEKIRSRGLGSAIVQNFLSMHPGILIVGECERPETETASRRLDFFRRLGFFVNEHQYMQPPYSESKSPVPMVIISHPRPISGSEFTAIRDTIYQGVYGCSGPGAGA
ncbi:MAG: hypothetical protein RDV48_20150 [Candidatus Eremiobacteraeota bacterium]|nr:hypothetical protein [Candidatus Eremiobacteraeota bacterium]